MYAGPLKKFDAIVGRLAAMLSPEPDTGFRATTIENILLVRPGGIGDAVHLVPTINNLKNAYPDTAIDILAEKRNSTIFALCPLVRTVLHYDKPIELLRALGNPYDVVIDTEQWHRLSAVIARLTKAGLLIGYATNERKRLFSHAVSYSHDIYEVESFFDLLSPLGIEKSLGTETPFLSVPVEAADSVKQLLGEFYRHPYVTIFPGASIPERRWGAEKFRSVAERLDAMGLPVVVVGGKVDVADGERIVSGSTGLNLAGKTSLEETAAVIARSALLVSGDSGILHIGVGLDKPTVSLFGPGIAKKWAPRGEKHVVLNKNLSCSPCTKFGYTPKCPLNARCMSEISVEEVTAAVVELFERYGKK